MRTERGGGKEQRCREEGEFCTSQSGKSMTSSTDLPVVLSDLRLINIVMLWACICACDPVK